LGIIGNNIGPEIFTWSKSFNKRFCREMLRSTARLIVKHDIEKRTMYLQPAVLVDETKLPEFIRENIAGLASGVQQALAIQQN
jgi:hypothetical protein